MARSSSTRRWTRSAAAPRRSVGGKLRCIKLAQSTFVPRAIESVVSVRQGHETTWAQIVAEELGLDPQTIMVEEGDTDTAPYRLGTYASRSTPVAGAAIAMATRRVREKAKKVAAHLLEVAEGDVEWTDYKFQVRVGIGIGAEADLDVVESPALLLPITSTNSRLGPHNRLIYAPNLLISC